MPTPNMDLKAADINKAVCIVLLPTGTAVSEDYIEFYDSSAPDDELKLKKMSISALAELLGTINGVLPPATASDVGKPVIVGTNGAFQLGDTRDSPVSKNFTVQVTDWRAIGNIAPFQWYSDKMFDISIPAGSTVELINDNPIEFARSGLALAAASQVAVRFVACSKPDAAVTLEVLIHG